MRNSVCLKMRKQRHRLAAWLPTPLHSVYRKNRPSTIFTKKFKSSNHFYCCSAPFVSDLFGNPGDRFSLAKARAMFLQGVCQNPAA